MRDPSALTEEQREWVETSELEGPKFAALGQAPRLVAFGAVPLSAAVCRASRAIGWVPYVVDPRERFTDHALFPDAEEILITWPAEAYARLGGLDARTAVVALAHAPALDDPALILALRSGAFYAGAIGSRRTQGRRRDRFIEAGLSEAELARLSGPAGLDLGGSTIEEAALAIVAEAVATMHGRGGARLTAFENAIHGAGRRA